MKKWKTKDGQELSIENMETSHIKNCISMLRRNGFVSFSEIARYFNLFFLVDPDPQDQFDRDFNTLPIVSEFLDLFEAELKNRNENQSMKEPKK